MSAAEDLLEELSGMISRSDAELLAESAEQMKGETQRSDIRANDVTDVAELLEFANANSVVRTPFIEEQKTVEYIVNVKDRLYRVFNQVDYDYRNGKGVKRELVLGREGKTARLTLFNNFSRLIDAAPFERGDTVLVRNAVLNVGNGTLKSTSRTVLLRVSPSGSGITNFSLLKGGERNIDIIGKVVEIYPIRYVNRLDAEGQIGVANCVISDMSESMNVAMWGSSALATININVNDAVKIEFCSVRIRNDVKEVYATDTSRILVNKNLESRLGYY